MFKKLYIRIAFALLFSFLLIRVIFELGGIAYSNDLVRKAKSIAEITKYQ